MATESEVNDSIKGLTLGIDNSNDKGTPTQKIKNKNKNESPNLNTNNSNTQTSNTPSPNKSKSISSKLNLIPSPTKGIPSMPIPLSLEEKRNRLREKNERLKNLSEKKVDVATLKRKILHEESLKSYDKVLREAKEKEKKEKEKFAEQFKTQAIQKQEKNKNKNNQTQQPQNIRIGLRVHQAAKNNVSVLEVARGSPAERADILVGDQIKMFNNRIIQNMDDFGSMIKALKPLTTVGVSLIREGSIYNTIIHIPKYSNTIQSNTSSSPSKLNDSEKNGVLHENDEAAVEAEALNKTQNGAAALSD